MAKAKKTQPRKTASKRASRTPSAPSSTELEAALADARADARAARNEVARLADENEMLRTRLDTAGR